MKNMRKRAKWDNDDFICSGYILNGILDSLFDIYHYMKFAKKFWSSFNDFMFLSSVSILFLRVSCMLVDVIYFGTFLSYVCNNLV